MPEMTVASDDVANAVRGLAMDAVRNANSGRPGTPMAMAEIGPALRKRVRSRNREAATELGPGATAVSTPSAHVFDRQPAGWREAVLPPAVPIVAVEAGAKHSWHRCVGREGAVVGIDVFGGSAAPPVLCKHLGLPAGAVEAAVKRVSWRNT